MSIKKAPYYLEMWTYTGYSGMYVEKLDTAIKTIENNHYWYYAKIMNHVDNVIISEQRRPFLVENVNILKDAYTGEYFTTPACFETLEEAEKIAEKINTQYLRGQRRFRGGKIFELRDKMDYLDI